LATTWSGCWADARLKPVNGETREQAILRLNGHYAGRANNHYRELSSAKEAAQRAEAQVSNLNTILQPFLRAFHQQQQALAQQEAMARVPDREADPDAYRTWLIEQDIQRRMAVDQQAAQQQQAWQQAQQEHAQAHQMLDVDERALAELENAVSTDQELAAAYSFVTNNGFRQAERLFPGEPPEKIQEFVQLAQQRDMRMYAQMGYSPVDAIKATYRDALELAGYSPAQASAEAAQVAPTVTAPAPQKPTIGSPTAARIERESAAGRARAVVSPAPGGSGAPTGDGIDITTMDEDALAEFALMSPQNAEYLSKRIQQTYGKRIR
jgi:hypothetical protein